MANYLENVEALKGLIVGRRYKLTRDVDNPEIDRRQRYDVNYTPWTKGMVFTVENVRDYALDKHIGIDKQLDPIIVLSHGGRSIGRTHGGIANLCAALELIPLSVRDYIDGNHVAAGFVIDVLQKLVDQGKVTLADVQAAIDAVHED